MNVRTRPIEYADGDTALEGMLTWDAAVAGARPGVLVAHTWAGRGPFEEETAAGLARLGYAGFALDLYGKGVRGETLGEKKALMQPFMDDRLWLQRRMAAALEAMRRQPEVDRERTAAIGFCFGGLCVLDLARSGADVDAVVSFHGLFTPPGDEADGPMPAKVLALHGWDDPMVPPEAVLGLARELSARGADWQIHAYGNTMHAFTNPEADDAGSGTVYQPDSARRAWQAMQNFLAETL